MDYHPSHPPPPHTGVRNASKKSYDCINGTTFPNSSLFVVEGKCKVYWNRGYVRTGHLTFAVTEICICTNIQIDSAYHKMVCCGRESASMNRILCEEILPTMQLLLHEVPPVSFIEGDFAHTTMHYF